MDAELEDRVVRAIIDSAGSAEAIAEGLERDDELRADLAMDSLDRTDLAMALEESFSLPEIPREMLERWRTVQDVIDTVRKLTEAKHGELSQR